MSGVKFHSVGDNTYGETTVLIVVQSGVIAIAAGGAHTVALLGAAVPLRAKRSGSELLLFWPAEATGLTLQSTLQLTPPVVWMDVTNPPVLVGGQWMVTNLFSGSAQYFRLHKP